MLNPSNQTNAGFLEVPFPGLLPENPSFYQTPAVHDSLQAKAIVPSTRTNMEDHFRQTNNPIDSIISQHMMKMRLELEERQKQQARLIVSAMVKKLKEKDEQIQRIGRLNIALQERVQSILLENQLWRDLALSNEATVNSLRKDLDQALARGVTEEDAESCCASSDDDGWKRKCRMCGEREPCVLVLPCRHLCLCGVCGSGSRQLQACPACNARMNATLHLNMSSS